MTSKARVSIQGMASATSYRITTVATASNAGSQRPAYALPGRRVGDQAYFWTEEWQQKERLADYDFLIGDAYRPIDVDDLLRELDEGD